jgi:hypothetical protein
MANSPAKTEVTDLGYSGNSFFNRLLSAHTVLRQAQPDLLANETMISDDEWR